MFERFIAKRYLISKKSIQFITIITFISIIGITVGVAALLAVLSVFNGFNKHVTAILTGFDPHLRILPSGRSTMTEYRDLTEKLLSESSIKGFAPYTLNKGVISSKKNNVVVFIKGVDDNNIEKISGVKDKIEAGEFKYYDDEKYGGIILGINLMGKLGVKLYDTLSVMSPAGMEKALTQIVQPKILRFVIRGIFDIDNRDYDKMYAFISIPYSQKLFELAEGVNGIDVRLDNINKSEDVKEYLQSQTGSKYRIETWYELHQELYSVMKAERFTAYIILSIIIAVASFSIAGSLTMTVIEKKRDIGILKAMGSNNKSIIRIFMYEGILIGIWGTIAGCLLGFLICILQIKFKLFQLDPTVYAPLDALPIDIRWADYLYVSAASMLLAFIASLYPALKAARQAPIEAIRWE
jgi:lipoprotein-releasing system permease protein